MVEINDTTELSLTSMTVSSLSTLLTTAVSLLSRLITLIGRSPDSDALLSLRFC